MPETILCECGHPHGASGECYGCACEAFRPAHPPTERTAVSRVFNGQRCPDDPPCDECLEREMETLRADAELGAALREVLAEKVGVLGMMSPLAIGSAGDVCYLHPDGSTTITAASRVLQDVLCASPRSIRRTMHPPHT